MALQIPAATRKVVYERDNMFCCRCGRYVGSGVYASVHHRYPRRMGGTKDERINDVRNLVLLCGTGTEGCHGWIESHRNLAGYQGWLLSSMDDFDSPYTDIYGQRVRLYSDGTKAYVHEA